LGEAAPVLKVWRMSLVMCAASTVAVGALTAGQGAALLPGDSDTKSERAIAKLAVLELEDFPTGWRSQRRESSREGDEAAAGISECKQLVALDKRAKKQPRARSRKFV
jgi:hypothetical protein